MAETFEIRLRVHSESDLYNSFDDEQQTLSSDVIDYLFDRYQEKDLKDSLTVHIVSDDPVDVDRFRAAFQNYLDAQKKALKKERNKNIVKQAWMFGIGIVFIAIGIYSADRLSAVAGEIISTIGAFATWEAASIWIVENPRNRLSRKWLDILSKTKIKCSIAA